MKFYNASMDEAQAKIVGLPIAPSFCTVVKLVCKTMDVVYFILSIIATLIGGWLLQEAGDKVIAIMFYLGGVNASIVFLGCIIDYAKSEYSKRYPPGTVFYK